MQRLLTGRQRKGVNFIGGGYSALVSKGMTTADKNLILSIPRPWLRPNGSAALSTWVPTKTGLNMDAGRAYGTDCDGNG